MLCRPIVFGVNQFAYITQRGARDAIALLTLTFIEGFARRKKFGLLCCDVSGAFDHVLTERLQAKLRAKGKSYLRNVFVICFFILCQV